MSDEDLTERAAFIAAAREMIDWLEATGLPVPWTLIAKPIFEDADPRQVLGDMAALSGARVQEPLPGDNHWALLKTFLREGDGREVSYIMWMHEVPEEVAA